MTYVLFRSIIIQNKYYCVMSAGNVHRYIKSTADEVKLSGVLETKQRLQIDGTLEKPI